MDFQTNHSGRQPQLPIPQRLTHWWSGVSAGVAQVGGRKEKRRKERTMNESEIIKHRLALAEIAQEDYSRVREATDSLFPDHNDWRLGFSAPKGLAAARKIREVTGCRVMWGFLGTYTHRGPLSSKGMLQNLRARRRGRGSVASLDEATTSKYCDAEKVARRTIY
jgi:hypothetical protein